MDREILLTEEALVRRFPFLPNPLNTNVPFDFGRGGAMFETYGAELNYVLAQPRNRIWTLIDAEGHLMIVSGCHFVNRLGYFISEVPVEIGSSFFCDLDEETEGGEP